MMKVLFQTTSLGKKLIFPIPMTGTPPPPPNKCSCQKEKFQSTGTTQKSDFKLQILKASRITINSQAKLTQ